MRIFGFNIGWAETRGANLKDPPEWLMAALIEAGGFGGVSATKQTVSPLTILGVATTYACVQCLADAVASIPLDLMKPDGLGGKVLATDSTLYSLFKYEPNSDMSPFDFMSAMQFSLSLRNKAFAEIVRDSDGDVGKLYPIEPKRVTVKRTADKRLYYSVQTDNEVLAMSSDKILHLRHMTDDGISSSDLARLLPEVFGLALALQDNAARFFGNGSRPGGVLEHPANLSAEAQKRLVDQFDNQASAARAYRTILLEEGMKYAKTRSENKDSQFQESREYQDLQICKIFRVPPHKVGITSSQPRANVEQENISFVVDVVRPQCILWEGALNQKLLSKEERDQGYEFRFRISDMLRGDIKSRYQAFALGRQWGWLSINDIRREEGLNPVEGGDSYLTPLNMTVVGKETETETEEIP